jgi:predicted P-loop ATPase
VQFLSDPTGTRRWLPFVVESIESPLTSPFDYEGIYSQAYALYRQGFRYWFDKDEITRLSQHNQQFETSRSANELIDEFFRKPVGTEGGDYLTASVILQQIGGATMKELNSVKVGRALMEMGFEHKILHGIQRYRVVRRSESDKEQNRHPQDSESEGVEVW